MEVDITELLVRREFDRSQFPVAVDDAKMRPSEDVLSSFYDLADLDANKRYSAVIKIVEACKSNGDYCMERLIGGLASPRAAARLGYTTALVHTLTKFSDNWPAKSLFDLAESKLDISKVEGSSPAALGRHLLYSAMITSQCYAEVCVELFERELAIFDKYHYFGMAIAQSLAGLSRQLDEKTFMKKIVPLIKGRVCVECDSFMSEWLLFILLIRDKFKDALKRNVKFFRSDGKLSIEKQNYEGFVNILKRTEGCAENTLARELLSAARDSGIFDAVYTDIVEKWLMNGDMYKVFQRCFGFVDELLSEDSTLKPNEFVVIFSSNLIAQFRSVRKSREYRFYAQIVESILEKLAKSLSSGQWKRSELISLLNTIDSTDGGNFDECFHAKSRITEKLIAQLDAKGVEIVVDKALNHGGWYVRRVAGVFGQWPDDIKEKVLVKLAKHETRSEEVHTTLCKCIDLMFSINVRAGRSVKMAFSEEDEKLLRDLLSAICVKKIKMPKCENRALSILALVLNIWSLTSSDSDERSSYSKNVSEVISIDKKLSSEGVNIEEPLSVLIDLLLSLLSRPHRYHRTVVHYVFASVVPQLTFQNLLHIFETIQLPDDEMMVGEKDEQEDEDDEGMQVDDEDHQNALDDGQNEEHDDTEDSEAKESGSDTDISEDEDIEDEQEEVDEEFKNKLKAALGDAAVPSDVDEDDDDKVSIDSTVSDETMFRLDEGLAAVFRERMKGARKASASTLEQIHQFRMKCFDLLLIVVSHENSAQFTSQFIIPLLQITRESLQRKNGDVMFNRASNLIEIIVKYKKGDVSEKKGAKLLKKMVAVSSQIVNPVLKSIVGNVSSFLFSTAYNADEKSVSEKMRSQVEELFCSYMTQSNNEILSELATAPVYKYPWVFTSFLPRIIDFAFDEEVRIYRRTEALACAVVFMRKDIVNDSSEANQKSWKKITKKLSSHAHTYLTALNVEDAKPRFFASLIKLLTAFGGIVTSSKEKQQLNEALGDDLKVLMGNTELWKNGGTMKRFNSASQTICGRSTLAALKQLSAVIGVK